MKITLKLNVIIIPDFLEVSECYKLRLNGSWHRLIYLHDKSDSRRKTYQLTDKGREVLEEDLKVRKLMIELAETGLEEER